MATIKSLNTILAEIRTFLKAYNRYLDTGDTSLAKDLVITPYSVGGKIVMDQVTASDNLHILSKLNGTDLDNEGTNYGLERNTGAFATVTLYFYATTLPVSDVVVSAGTQASTAGTTFAPPVLFSTVAETTFTVASAPSYYSYDRARYEFPVAAIANNTGTIGNVGAGLIIRIITPISQINGVTNLISSSGGTGTESDDDFRKRINLKMLGRDINTVDGLRVFARSHNFTDAYAIRIEDSLAERTDGVDLFVIDQYSSPATDTFTYYASTVRYYLTNRPAVDVTSIVSAVVGPVGTADYSVSIDNTTPLRRSTEAADYITIRASAGIPDGTTFTVTYTYSQNVANLQNTIDQVTNKVITSNVLIKRAYPLHFYVNATLTLIANADGPTTRSTVKNALIQFFTNYRLGSPVQESDIIIVMQQGYGDYPVNTVDSVVINSFYLQDEFGTIYNPVSESITVGNTQYAVYGNAVVL